MYRAGFLRKRVCLRQTLLRIAETLFEKKKKGI